MWIPKHLYEAIPYIYGALGLVFITASWTHTTGFLSAVLVVAGSGLLLIGLVLWLRRRDFRDAQRHYKQQPLE